MFNFYLVLVLLIVLTNGVQNYNFLTHKFSNIETWKYPQILRRSNLNFIKNGTIELPVDHFDASVNTTFHMRYFKNEMHFENGGPIIIYMGGEWVISAGPLQNSFTYEMTKEQKGVMFYTEHRYYGYSRPTPDLSTQNLRHLSVDQALADVAFFIESLKQEPKYKKSPVIVVGGSYSANMAVWMRSKYPHLVQGALASSAPIYAKAEFNEYVQVVTNVLRLHGEDCVENIKLAFLELANLTQTSKDLQKVKKYFKICNSSVPTNKKDIILLFHNIGMLFKESVQNDKPYNGTTLTGLICKVMNSETYGTPLKRLSYLFRDDKDCKDMRYKNMIKYYTNTNSSKNHRDIFRQWIYQTCTEFGYYVTTTPDSIFGHYITLDYHEQLCEDLFGINYNKTLINRRIKRTNLVYGGRNPEVSNVIFTNGSKDPWHVLSRITPLNDHSPSYFINGTSHCYDLLSSKPTDSDELKAVRKQVKTDIARIIQLAKEKMNE